MKQGIFLIGCVLLIACGKKEPSKPDSSPPLTSLAPAAVVLSFPIQNEECTAGIVVSDTQSAIPFSWNKAEHAEMYEIHVKNLENGSSISQSTVHTSLKLTLRRNTPYSWYIISKTSKSATTTNSATWKFYNSGPGTTTYAPFPAELVSPTMGQSLNGVEKITLDWTGSDVDEDIVSYDVYFGTTQTPALLKENLTESRLKEVSVKPNTMYRWKIITRDAKGNSSESGMFLFSVQ